MCRRVALVCRECYCRPRVRDAVGWRSCVQQQSRGSKLPRPLSRPATWCSRSAERSKHIMKCSLNGRKMRVGVLR